MLLINTTIDKIQNSFITYQLRDEKGIVRYIGTSRFRHLLNLPIIVNQFFLPNQNMTIEQVFISLSRSECHAKRLELLKQHPNLISIKGQHGIPIICRETGEVFQTLQEVVNKHKCTLASLCRHLQGKESYLTVRGRTYYRGV